MSVTQLANAACETIEEPTKSNTSERFVLQFGPPDSTNDKEKEVLEKYNDIVKELSIQDQLDICGVNFVTAFPPLDRDVEKLVIDLNLIVYKYMQVKMESDSELRAETICSTVTLALKRVFEKISEDKL